LDFLKCSIIHIWPRVIDVRGVLDFLFCSFQVVLRVENVIIWWSQMYNYKLCHNLILDLLKLFVYLSFLFKNKIKIKNLNPKIFLGHEEISFRAAKYQNTIRIARSRDFDKMRWRKKENWGWDLNMTKTGRIN